MSAQAFCLIWAGSSAGEFLRKLCDLYQALQKEVTERVREQEGESQAETVKGGNLEGAGKCKNE